MYEVGTIDLISVGNIKDKLQDLVQIESFLPHAHFLFALYLGLLTMDAFVVRCIIIINLLGTNVKGTLHIPSRLLLNGLNIFVRNCVFFWLWSIQKSSLHQLKNNYLLRDCTKTNVDIELKSKRKWIKNCFSRGNINYCLLIIYLREMKE